MICMVLESTAWTSESWLGQRHARSGACAAWPATYDSNPGKLQLRVHQAATCKVKVDGVAVEPFPLLEALDGKNPASHGAQVEPSVHGGEQMGKACAALV